MPGPEFNWRLYRHTAAARKPVRPAVIVIQQRVGRRYGRMPIKGVAFAARAASQSRAAGRARLARTSSYPLDSGVINLGPAASLNAWAKDFTPLPTAGPVRKP